MQTTQHVAISDLTTMRLGGPATCVTEVCSSDGCVRAYEFAAAKGLPVYVLGGGSNVIGRDEGFDGVVLLNKLVGIEVIDESPTEVTIKVASGEELDNLVAFATARGLSGIEALSAIPGSVGGAVMQNAGAYGQEIADVLGSVEVYDTLEHQFVVLEQSKLDLAYRHSIFNSSAKGRYFILSATVRLSRSVLEGVLFGSLQAYLDERKITDRSPEIIRNAVMDIRATKLPDPLNEASSGSFFKNVTIRKDERKALRERHPGMPVFETELGWRISSGWMIEQCGLSGQLLH
ncbi:MAG: UDP-N-acetylmuramate dehydrogenase, partial [Coriobacteriales bacterium]|nr:UDP-N-acetylmuramate dehydrogenase [Coriobacteriales bacterium]